MKEKTASTGVKWSNGVLCEEVSFAPIAAVSSGIV